VVHRLDTPLELLLDSVHPFALQEHLCPVQRRRLCSLLAMLPTLFYPLIVPLGLWV